MEEEHRNKQENICCYANHFGGTSAVAGCSQAKCSSNRLTTIRPGKAETQLVERLRKCSVDSFSEKTPNSLRLLQETWCVSSDVPSFFLLSNSNMLTPGVKGADSPLERYVKNVR